jgi:transporter family protein
MYNWIMSPFWLAVMTAVIWGIVPLFEKTGLSKLTPLTGLFYRCFGVVLGLVLLGIFFVKPAEIKSADFKSVCFLIIAGFLASVAAQVLFYNALKVGEVSRTTLVAGSYPLITFILGILIFGESVTPFKILGAAAVIMGLWFLKIG